MKVFEIVKIGMIAAGIIIIFASFWFHAVKKMTVNLAVIWEFLGLVLILAGSIPALSGWTKLVSAGTVTVLFFLGLIFLMAGFQFSLSISEMAIKNKELFMQVSMLVSENEMILNELEKMNQVIKQENLDETCEKDIICN